MLNNISISVEPSSPDPHPSMDNPNSELVQMSIQDRSGVIESTRDSDVIQKKSWWSKHRSFTQVCAFIWFAIISMIVGITIVCVIASRRRNAPCYITFTQTMKRTIIHDSRPRHVAIGDFNQDDYLDLVIANSGIDNIGVRLSDSNGSFENQTFYSTGSGSQPCWVAVKDLNKDNLLDIIVANYGNNNIGVFLGRVTGSFASQITFSLGASRPVSLAMGDFNNDNQWDIAVASNGTFTVTILFGIGDGTFEIEPLYSMGYDSMPCSIAVTDINKDSQPDIVVANYGTSELVLLLATGNGTFSINKYSTGTNSHPTSVTIDNLNADNYTDIAVANSGTHNVGIFFGSSNGTFAPMQVFPTGSTGALQFIVAGQFSNDSERDLVVADSGENQVIVFVGDGRGNFIIRTNQSTGYSSNPCSIVVADFNHDKQSDIVIVNNGINNILLFDSYMFHPTANQTTYSTGAYSSPNFVAVAYFNNDTYLDIAVANTYTSNVGMFMGIGNGAFASQKIVPMVSDEYNPYSLGIGNFNNDGYLDLAVVISNYDEIVIYFGQENGTFVAEEKTYSVDDTSFPCSITIADWNGDGIDDMATGNYDANNLAVFLGTSNGKFSDPTYYDLTEDDLCPIFITTGDFNDDGVLDLVSANDASATITIFLGNGNGTFQNASSIPINDFYASWIVLGYLNNDTQLDIVFTSPDSSIIGILLGNGNGTFQELYTYMTDDGVGPSSVVLGNFNRDNISDIAVANEIDSSITIFLRTINKDLITQETIYLEDGDSPSCIATGDFNNDSTIDIVVGNSESNDISVLLLQYQASFENQTGYPQGSGAHPYSVTGGDFNGDYQLDVVVANSGTDNVQILIGYHDGTFTNEITYPTGHNSYPYYVVTADFDKDNQPDIAVVNFRDQNLMVILNAGNQTLSRSVFYSTGAKSFPNSIAVGDFNKDGWIDVVVSNSNTDSVSVFLGFNYPNFTIVQPIRSERGSFPTYIAVGKFNGDSQWDFAIVYQKTATINIFLGSGNGTFLNKSSNLIDNADRIISFTIGDFNNDTQSDIAVANLDSSIHILLGNGDGTFADPTYQSTNDFSPIFITVGHFNQDRIQDLVVAYDKYDNIGVFLGYGNGSFAEQILYSMPNGSNPIQIGVDDFDKDNISDLAVANQNGNNICILLGNGNGTFKNLTSYSTGNRSNPSAIAMGDFDKDNYVDIVVANAGSKKIGIFFGYGNGTFSSQITYAPDLHSILTSIVVEDLNNDTLLDIAITNSGDGNGNIGVFYGLGNRKFLVPKMYSTGSKTQASSIAIKDFNNDGQMDFIVSTPKKNRIAIMLRNESEPFGLRTVFLTGTGSNPSAVGVNDFDNDGQLDIAVACYKTNDIRILFGYGNGTFGRLESFSTGSSSRPNSLVISDMDGDKQYDIVVANYNTNEIGILFGYGNGDFDTVKTYSTGLKSGPFFAAVADLNKDNRTDIVVANNGINTVLVLFATSNKTFLKSESYSYSYDYRPTSVFIGDFNNDTWFDIAVTNDGAGYVDILLHTC